MLSTAIIVFRESFEVAIVIAILMAATRGIRGRGRWIAIGIGAGVVAAAILGFFADRLDRWIAGRGSELVHALFLVLTVLMIAWTVAWVKAHARTLATDAKRLGAAVSAGEKPLWALAIAVGAASVRDGSELVVFLYGLALSQELTLVAALTGAAVGLAIGGGLGVLMYQGILRVAPKHLFLVVGILLSFLAAGMASQAASLLIAADVLPPLVDPVWDLSETLPETGTLGLLLKTIFGYASRPAASQLLAYAAVFIAIAAMALRPTPPLRPAAARS